MMVTRLSPGAVVAVAPSTTPRLGDGGGAIVPFKLGSALSHSSSGLAASGGGSFPLEESLAETLELLQHPPSRLQKKKQPGKRADSRAQFSQEYAWIKEVGRYAGPL